MKAMNPVYRFLHVTEVYLRLLLVNLPARGLEKLPELNRLAALMFMYFLMLFVGLLWTFMLNAAMSLALSFASAVARISFQSSSLQAMAAFYVWYATFRVLISFGKRVSMTAWESLDDFPSAAKALVSSVDLWWYFTPVMFVPVFTTALGLLVAPWLCKPHYGRPLLDKYADVMCNHTLLRYMTLDHRPVRKTVTFTIVILVVQLLQVLLHQFPQWRPTLRKTPAGVRYALQFSLFVLLAATLVQLWGHVQQHSLMALFLPQIALYSIEDVAWRWPALIIGWLVWFELLVTLLIKYGREGWRNVVTTENAQLMFRNTRIVLLAFIILEFMWGCTHSDIGFMEAQLQFTITTLVIPVVYVLLNIVAELSTRMSMNLFVGGVLVALATSMVVCYIGDVQGPGSVSIVFCHLFGKLVQIFGTNERVGVVRDDESDYGDEHPAGIEADGTSLAVPTTDSNVDAGYDTAQSHNGKLPRRRRSNTEPPVGTSKQDPSEQKQQRRVRINEPNARSDDHDDETGSVVSYLSTITRHLPSKSREFVQQSLTHLTSMSDVVLTNLPTSPLVQGSLLPASIRESYPYRWAMSMWQTCLTLVRVLFLPSSVYEGIAKAGTGLLLFFSTLFGIFSLAAIIQNNLKWYPDLIDFKHTTNSFFIDHAKISTVELIKPTSTSPAELYSSSADSCSEAADLSLAIPKYAFCDSNIMGLTMLDYALLSEVAYFDDKEDEIQTILDGLFPAEMGVKHVGSSKHDPEGRPVALFTEVHVSSLNLTVIAIRGTDLGRLSDFVEDMKLWTEPFAFMLLAAVFPTVRFWPDNVKLTLIQWLQETLHFFGMKQEAEYHRVLVRRVKELQGQRVVLTGHSLGGGLGHVVGSMVDTASVAFSPPGIGQSYKKYTFALDDNEFTIDPRFLHHLKLTVLPDFDLIPLVDSQIGLVQRVVCEKPTLAHQNACHMMEGTICSILNHCGDSRGRFTKCLWKFDVSRGWPVAQEFLINYGHWVFLAIVCAVLTLAMVAMPSYI